MQAPPPKRPNHTPDHTPDQTPAATARRVLGIEMAGLARLAEDLPPDFSPFVTDVLAMTSASNTVLAGTSASTPNTTGRLIVSGIGKSAHIGRKISATLASTGTPSIFVHATEASHGDLGMIVPGDMAIVISKSGETRELSDLLAYCKRFSIPVAAITADPDSTLGRAASYLLRLPAAEEACAIGMAPTTSALLTLAMGDALAVALMEGRGFTPERFKAFHPGGKLGLQLVTVGELMHGVRELPLVGQDLPMAETLIEMTGRGFGAALVLDAGGALTGIITDGDLRRHMADLMGAHGARVARDIASADPMTVTPDTFAVEALAQMNARKIYVVAVVDAAHHPVGILHMHDLLRAGLGSV